MQRYSFVKENVSNVSVKKAKSLGRVKRCYISKNFNFSGKKLIEVSTLLDVKLVHSKSFSLNRDTNVWKVTDISTKSNNNALKSRIDNKGKTKSTSGLFWDRFIGFMQAISEATGRAFSTEIELIKYTIADSIFASELNFDQLQSNCKDFIFTLPTGASSV
jgi:hypothetical protein